MSPERTDLKTKYLLIAGPPTFGHTPEDRAIVDGAVDKALASWGMHLSDYTGIVSGGLGGVDAYIGGMDFNRKVEDTYTFQKTGKKALVVKPNKARNGVGANLYQSNLLCEIADDIILFKPKGHVNNRMSAMQVWINNDKDKRLSDGYSPRRVGISGDKEISLPHENFLIPVMAYGEEGTLENDLPSINEDDLPY